MAQLTGRGTIALFASRSGKTSFFNGLVRPRKIYESLRWIERGMTLVCSIIGALRKRNYRRRAESGFGKFACRSCKEAAATALAGPGTNRSTGREKWTKTLCPL